MVCDNLDFKWQSADFKETRLDPTTNNQEGTHQTFHAKEVIIYKIFKI